jgi:hypothetical protein
MGFRVWGLGYGVWDVGLGVWGFGAVLRFLLVVRPEVNTSTREGEWEGGREIVCMCVCVCVCVHMP